MRLRLLLSCCALWALAGCTRESPEASAPLMPQVRQRLAERDAKLTSYRLAGTVKDEGQEAVAFTFDYRAPQRMRGSLGTPAARTFAWDGTRLFEQQHAQKRFTTFASELPPAKLAGFLAETFGPLTPEGFRAPLLTSAATARRASHPRAPQAVELVQQVEDGAGRLELVYVLRWPALDFLGKRTRAPDGTEAEVRVEDEHCEEAAGLCVPRRLTRWLGGRQVGETVLSRVELNAPVPNDAFTLPAPEGYEVQTRTLVEATPAAPTGG